MSVLAALIGAGLRANYRNRSMVIVVLVLMLFFIALMIVLICALVIVPQLRSDHPDAGEVARYLSLLVYGTGFFAMGMNVNVLTANNLVKEKAQRLHESLLACPVGVRGLWTAKSLAVFLPGFVLAEILSAAVLVGVNVFLVAPRLGFLVPPSLFVAGFVLIPVLYLPLSFLVLLVGLTGNPVSGNVIGQLLFSILITLAINLVVRGGLDVASPVFVLIHFGLSLAAGILVLILQARLTKERVVLSAKA